MKTIKHSLVPVLIAVTLTAASAQAAQSYWAVQSGDFSTAGNWSPAAPTAFDAPTFNNAAQGVLANQSINMDVSASVLTVFSDWDAGGYVNTVGGPGTLTVTGGGAWTQGIANRSGANGGGTLNMTGNVVVNNPAGVTDVRTQNGANNVLAFTPSSSLSIDTTLVTLQFGGGSIQFNGAIDGIANLMIQSGNVSFNAGHDSSAHGGNILMNESFAKLTINGGTVGNSGNQLIGNYGGNLVELNGANAINGMGISAWGALTLDLNAGQDDFGAINEVQNSLTLDVTDLGAGEEVWFDNSAGGAWAGTVSILGFQEGVIRFGSDSSGLTPGQLEKINGGIYSLTGSGFLTVVPEPTAAALLLFSGVGLLAARRLRV